MTSFQINTPELQQILCAELGGDVALPSEVRIIDGSVEHGKGMARLTDGDVIKVRVFDRWRQIESLRTSPKLVPMKVQIDVPAMAAT